MNKAEVIDDIRRSLDKAVEWELHRSRPSVPDGEVDGWVKRKPGPRGEIRLVLHYDEPQVVEGPEG